MGTNQPERERKREKGRKEEVNQLTPGSRVVLVVGVGATEEQCGQIRALFEHRFCSSSTAIPATPPRGIILSF